MPEKKDKKINSEEPLIDKSGELLKKLIAKGKRKGFLKRDECENILEEGQFEDKDEFYSKVESLYIQIYDEESDENSSEDSDAEVVVAGGRGLGGPEPFETLEEIAVLLNAAVGASRAVCDAGWKDHSYQIGLTGKDISPNLYFTVGISGASQHMAGCGNSKHIVSIDKNIDANIFKDAEFGAVGDWKNILPGFLDTLKDLGKE